MPKIKTHKGATKRFKVTGNGKIKRNKANRRHLLTGKSPNRIRNLRKGGLVSDAQHENVKKLLSYLV
ncbi:50S ribosomal protein L35 [Thermodesulfovibrionales bacterium]|nr:50S ribosomal protein L35 [Thermodesulfovibrionales bacterium]